jgi:signal recognition particle subunit SRP54
MIDSMTNDERHNPEAINASRLWRIASGCGAQDVKNFLRQFDQVRTNMRQLAQMSVFERIKMKMELEE